MKYFTRIEIDKIKRPVYNERLDVIEGVMRMGSRTQQWISEDLYNSLSADEKKLFIEVPSNQ